MDSLNLSLGFDDDDESGIMERSEQALRAHHSRNHTSSSSGGGALSRTPLGGDDSERHYMQDTSSAVRRRPGRPPGSKNKATKAPLVAPTYAQHPSTKRPSEDGSDSRKRPRSAEHSEFAPPPVPTKGAYQLAPSHDSENVERSLRTLGITRPEDQTALREMAVELLPGRAVSEDSASFSRRFAVDVADMYGPGRCPICEETMTFHFQDAKIRMGSGDRMAERSLTVQQRQKQRFALAIQARANLSESDQKGHEVLYNIEHALRGRFADDRIFRLLLLLRRGLVEKHLERYQIQYVKWTLPMLERHYDPEQNHFYQPLRMAHKHRLMAEEQLRWAHEATRPGGNYDFRGPTAFAKALECVQKIATEIDNRLDMAEPNVNETLRVLSVAIFRAVVDDGAMKLMQDPEMAAGKLVGGATGTHEPHSTYTLAHISAQ